MEGELVELSLSLTDADAVAAGETGSGGRSAAGGGADGNDTLSLETPRVEIRSSNDGRLFNRCTPSPNIRFNQLLDGWKAPNSRWPVGAAQR